MNTNGKYEVGLNQVCLVQILGLLSGFLVACPAPYTDLHPGRMEIGQVTGLCVRLFKELHS